MLYQPRYLRTAAAIIALAWFAPGCQRSAPPAVDAEPVVPVETENDLVVEQRCDVPTPPEELRTVQVVFSCDELPVGTWRVLEDGAVDTLRFALQQLLAGPTAEERASGLSSFFSDATAGMLNGVVLRDGVARIDFADFSTIIPNASTSAGSRELLDQIAGTIFQFDGVREAEITFNGSCDAFWNWLQRGCERLSRSGSA